MSSLQERLNAWDRMSAYWAGDEMYYLVRDYVLKPVIPDINEKFGVNHRIVEYYGAGHTGSDIGAMAITVPREKKPGLRNAIRHWLQPRDAVVVVELRSRGMTSRIRYSPPYGEYALKIKENYDSLLQDKFGIVLQLKPSA